MLNTQSPFVLLDDAWREHAVAARLYKDPIECIDIAHGDQLPELFERLRQARSAGHHVAGFLGYESGIGLNGISGIKAGDAGSGWFGIFESYQEIAPEAVTSIIPDPDGAWIGPIKPDISRDEYYHAFARVQEYILAGDIYQANLTFRAQANFTGDPLALYAAIRPQAAAGYGGVIWTGKNWLLSFSPELFFALKNGRVTTKPMKGTADRSETACGKSDDRRSSPQ
jgi:chorismate binding enzyme